MSEFGDFLYEKCMSFSIRIVNIYSYLKKDKEEYVLSKQMLRSGTSIGANISEAQSAISRKDFLAKAYIALKEASETIYWITLLYRTEYLTKEEYESIYNDCNEIKKLLTSITKTISSGNKL